MNPIETIEREIQGNLPSVWTRVRRPRNPNGEWWLDARESDHTVTIQWSPRRGFGVSASFLGDGYGEGPEETFDDEKKVIARVVDLLKTKSHTAPPMNVMLQELRALIGMTQEKLAERLGVQQAAVSRLERREDISLSSLRRFVTGLGAELEINIKTPNGESLRLSDGGEGTKSRRATCAHVEEVLPPPQPTVALPLDTCSEWLSDFESAVRSRWQLRCASLFLERAHVAGLASSDPVLGRIAIDESNVSRVFGAWTLVSGETQIAAYHSVVRHLIAHEIGHFVYARRGEEPVLAKFPHHELRADAVAGWLAGRAGDDPLLGTTVSSQLGCWVAHCTHPRPEERSFAYLSGHIEGSRERASVPSMRLFVVRTANLERSRLFYSGLGLDLRPEKHGDGPLHYSSTIAGTILELYPATRQIGGLRLGLSLPAVTPVLKHLEVAGLLSKPPQAIDRDGRSSAYLVRDPDGNAIELDQRDSTQLSEPILARVG